MADLTRKRSRDRLKIQRAPYWHRLDKGAYLGFRRGPDTWQARYRSRELDDNGNRKQLFRSFGDGLDYDEAKKAAEAWFEQLGAAPVRSVHRGTVRAALETYLDWLKEQGREATEKTCRQRFELIVWDDPIAEITLADLTRDDMREWRDRLREGRQPRSINRHVRSIVAGLNRALAEGHIGNAEAWKLAPLADDIDDSGETAVMLTAEQREAIIKAADPATALFLRGLELTGARPKELAAAVVSDFDKATGTLRLQHRKGRPAKLRTRAVVLSNDGIAFFAKAKRGKTPKAPLLTGPSGGHWDRHQWSKLTRTAITAHNKTAKGKKRIPVAASAYSFRHARISELLQVYKIDPLTVAAQTGTSLRMIERSYFRFIPDAMREKLASIGESAK